MAAPKRGVKTRCGGAWTEARYFSFIRNALRAAFRKYPPKYEATAEAKIGRNQYVCAHCEEVFGAKDVQVDHIVPCGSLKTYDDLPAFVERMFCEKDGFQVLCKPCHQAKTNAERQAKKETGE